MARFKECFKCKTVQPLTEFYKNQAMADGHLNKCKTCAKNDVATHRLQNLEKIRAYDRRRAKLPKRAKAAQKRVAAWRQADKRRTAAHNAVARALKAGKLVWQPCIRCGEQKSIAHHEDYDYSLKVMWLCQPCHKQRHKELNATSF